MQKIHEVAEVIRSTPELIELIQTSEYTNATYKPKSKKRSQSGLAMECFWAGPDGVRFRMRFEKHLGDKAAGLLRCGGAKTKSAVFSLIIEHRLAKGLET